MKILKLYFLLWMLTTILSCKSTPEYIEVPVDVFVTIDPEWDEPPAGEPLEPREDGISLSSHLLSRVSYYKTLVELWESWGIQAYEAVDLPLPESLILAKNILENKDEPD